ncbi:hypothetical protein SAY87_023215 [Trapa incisa]|uniref:Pectinesterase inhibitor domain-containing protein n=2 Tax=Trapa TaxID=22665 RepID=A0AAN7QXA7_TRANT|nr:hypothetical protein SAY87_023215 [Trapa incisa]KAK4783409.1 hypothetical protein SAY86_007783 [Trapa natans]
MSPAAMLSTLTLFVVLLLPGPSAAASHGQRRPNDLVHLSCVHARYPSLCFRTLASYSGPANPRSIAQAAVGASLSRARSVSGFLRGQALGQGGHLSKREQAALGDCVEQISDSIDQLSRTLRELQHLKGETLQWQISNAETWVSAALTNEDTCLDGFEGVDGKVKTDVGRRITRVARLTSNALYMIVRLDVSRGRPKGRVYP